MLPLAAAVDLIAIALERRAMDLRMSSIKNVRLRMLFEE